MGTLANYIGIIGVILCLLAFFNCQIERWKFDSYAYLLANGFGSCAILVSLFYHWNLPAFLMEVAWLGTSVLGIIRALRKNK